MQFEKLKASFRENPLGKAMMAGPGKVFWNPSRAQTARRPARPLSALTCPPDLTSKDLK
jgi:hypothetical protein